MRPRSLVEHHQTEQKPEDGELRDRDPSHHERPSSDRQAGKYQSQGFEPAGAGKQTGIAAVDGDSPCDGKCEWHRHYER